MHGTLREKALLPKDPNVPLFLQRAGQPMFPHSFLSSDLALLSARGTSKKFPTFMRTYIREWIVLSAILFLRSECTRD